MSQKYFYILILLGLLFVSACRPQLKQTEGQYFDLEKFVANQVEWLEKQNPNVRKQLAGKKVKTLKVNNWQRELSLFADANINRSRYLGEYRVSNKTLSDGTSLETYESLSDDFPVNQMKVHYNPKKKLKKIEVKMQQENYLYRSQKQLVFECQNQKIKLYYIKGEQESLMGGKNKYQVSGEILL